MKRMLRRGIPALLLSASVVTACSEEPPARWDQLATFTPLDLADRQVYLSTTAQRAVILDPIRTADGVALDIKVEPTGGDLGVSGVSSDGSRFYAVDEDSETLLIGDGETGEITRLELDAAYDRIAVDPEGDFLLLYFSGETDGTIVARNLNEVGIVDLRAAQPTAEFLTLSSRPLDVRFAPPVTLDGAAQRFAAVLSANEVTLLDLEELDNVDDALREVPLTISEADQVRRPVSVQFDVTPTEEEPNVVKLYILAEASDDITEVSIQPSVLPDAPRKLDLAVNQLAAGSTPGKMILLELPSGTRMIAIDRTRPRFTIVDVASGEGATFDLPMTGAATDMLVYDTTIEVDGQDLPETRVLAYSTSSPLVSVIRPETIAVSGDEPTLGRSVEAIRLERTPSSIRLAEGQPDRAIAFHEGVSAGFTILDLRKNNDIPIQGGTLRDVHFDGTFAYATFRSLENLTIFGLDGHPTNFDLPAVGVDVFFDTEDELLLIRHNGRDGMFTVLDANEPTPENARVYDNVFFTDIFDQELTR